jgi:hypothetical protein
VVWSCQRVPASTCWSYLLGEIPSHQHLPCLLWSCQRVPTSTCWSYLLGESPSHQHLPPTTPTVVLPESAYQYLLVLPAECKPQPPIPAFSSLAGDCLPTYRDGARLRKRAYPPSPPASLCWTLFYQHSKGCPPSSPASLRRTLLYQSSKGCPPSSPTSLL